MRSAVVFAAAAIVLSGIVYADCPNACSGNGDCVTNHDYCVCYNGFMGNDCSQRTCPVGLSFIDTPFGDIDGDNQLLSGGADSTRVPQGVNNALNPQFRPYGTWESHPAQLYGTPGDAHLHPDYFYFPVQYNEGHFYAECSNRGVCDRSTGFCTCFTGYEGTACNRTSCPNDCSGNGRCRRIGDLTPAGTHYRLWDADKTQVCECDGGFFGPDCSNQKCMTGDDPLTTTTTRTNYTYGIQEAGEVQVLDIRCPYYGTMVSPALITLTYTDVQFGDQYQTPQFDILEATSTTYANEGIDTPLQLNTQTATGNVLPLLLNLPNQVLSTYADGSTNGAQKVIGVTVTTVDADQWYRLTVTFASSLGNVPLLKGTPYFKCVGGAEVNSNAENVAVTFIGDGPAYDLKFVFTAVGSTNKFDVTVYNASGAQLGDSIGGAGITPPTTATQISGTLLTTDSGTNNIDGYYFGREAAKVQFAFLGSTPAATGEVTTIKIHTVPVITANNILYSLNTKGSSRSSADSKITLDDSAVYGFGSTAPSLLGIDIAVSLTQISGAVYQIALNGETQGVATITGSATAIQTLTGILPAAGSSSSTLFGAYLANAKLAWVTGSASSYSFWFPKEPIAFAKYYKTAPVSTTGTVGAPSNAYFSSGTIDDIYPSYYNYQPLAGPLALILQVTKINTAVDEYRWKTAGDVAWSDTFYAIDDEETDNNWLGASHTGDSGNQFAGGNIISCTRPSGNAGVNPWVLPTKCFTSTTQKSTDASGVTGYTYNSGGSATTISVGNNGGVTPSVASGAAVLDFSIPGYVGGSQFTTGSTSEGDLTGVSGTNYVASGTNAPATALHNLGSFLRAYPNDPIRQSIVNLRLSWNSGADNQARLCNTAAATYYLQFGTDGLNDAPECSGRGVCDYTSGICKCFKGYAGVDCTSASALAGGTSTTAGGAITGA